MSKTKDSGRAAASPTAATPSPRDVRVASRDSANESAPASERTSSSRKRKAAASPIAPRIDVHPIVRVRRRLYASRTSMSTSIPAAALVPAVARGDVSAFEALYDRYASTIYALLLRILCNADDAQEILQE